MIKSNKEILNLLLEKDPTEVNALKSVDFAIRYLNYNKSMIRDKSGSSMDYYLYAGFTIGFGLISLIMGIYLFFNTHLINNIGYMIGMLVLFYLFLSNIFSINDSKPIEHFQIYRKIQDDMIKNKAELIKKEKLDNVQKLAEEYLDIK